MLYLQLFGVHAAPRAASALQDDNFEAEAAQLPGSCKTCSHLLGCQASIAGEPLCGTSNIPSLRDSVSVRSS